MLSAMRGLLSTWVAKGLFVLLVFSFAIWGIGDVVDAFRRGDTSVATVAGQKIEVPEMQEALRREVEQFRRATGGQIEPTPELRRALANQALDRLITGRAMAAEIARLGLRVPDAQLRDAVFRVPAFQGEDQRFSRALFENFLRSNGMTEARFLELYRGDIAQRELAAAIGAGAASPEALTMPLFRSAGEQRSALMALVPFDAGPAPTLPDEAELRRFQENNPDAFSTPEYRTAQVALLTPDALASGIEVSDEDVATAYEQRQAQFVTGEQRDFAAVTVQDRAKAEAIATQWREGADFAAIEKAASEAGGSAFQLSGNRASVPVPELAEAAFGASPDTVTGPVQSPLGWHVLRVSKVTPGTNRTLDQVREELRTQLKRERATDRMFDVANQMEDQLAGGGTVAEVARTLSLPLVEATLDASGNGQDGKPVAMPLTQEGRAALLRIVFETGADLPPRTDEIAGPAFAATTVSAIIPPALRPFETVADAVRTAWVRDARRHAAEEKAAGLLGAVRGGQTLTLAATAAGLQARPVGPVGREGSPDVPRELVGPLFQIKQDEATMAETAVGFVVAQLTAVTPADATTDALGFGRMRDQIAQGIAHDLEQEYLAAIRAKAEPTINHQLLDQLAQP